MTTSNSNPRNPGNPGDPGDPARPGNPASERTTLLVLAIAGVVIWIACARYAGMTEAWDGMSYFFVGIPLMILFAIWAGVRHRSHHLRFGLALVVGQWLTATITSGLGPIALVGLAAFLGLAALCAAASWLASRATSDSTSASG